MYVPSLRVICPLLIIFTGHKAKLKIRKCMHIFMRSIRIWTFCWYISVQENFDYETGKKQQHCKYKLRAIISFTFVPHYSITLTVARLNHHCDTHLFSHYFVKWPDMVNIGGEMRKNVVQGTRRPYHHLNEINQKTSGGYAAVIEHLY